MILTDNQFLHLTGQDCKYMLLELINMCYLLINPCICSFLVNPSREHVFYLTFPKEWTTNNIVQLFSPFGKLKVYVIIIYRNMSLEVGGLGGLNSWAGR